MNIKNGMIRARNELENIEGIQRYLIVAVNEKEKTLGPLVHKSENVSVGAKGTVGETIELIILLIDHIHKTYQLPVATILATILRAFGAGGEPDEGESEKE